MGRQLTFDAIDSERSQATFDPSQCYRYWLARIWDLQRPAVNFIMLNPNGGPIPKYPTVTRCLHYARRWGIQHAPRDEYPCPSLHQKALYIRPASASNCWTTSTRGAVASISAVHVLRRRGSTSRRYRKISACSSGLFP